MCRSFRAKYRMDVTDVFQLFQTVKDTGLDARGVCTVFGKIPVKVAVMKPAWICAFGRIGFVGVIVKLSCFVSAFENRDSWQG